MVAEANVDVIIDYKFRECHDTLLKMYEKNVQGKQGNQGEPQVSLDKVIFFESNVLIFF